MAAQQHAQKLLLARVPSVGMVSPLTLQAVPGRKQIEAVEEGNVESSPISRHFLMGRAGLEPATLGLKVLHIGGKPNLKKRRFEPLVKPFRT